MTPEKEFTMQLITVRIEKPDDANFILGQTHFIKSVEDIHEALVAAAPGIKFGLAFCEASGKCLVRWSGTDPGMVELARKNACHRLRLEDGAEGPAARAGRHRHALGRRQAGGAENAAPDPAVDLGVGRDI